MRDTISKQNKETNKQGGEQQKKTHEVNLWLLYITNTPMSPKKYIKERNEGSQTQEATQKPNSLYAATATKTAMCMALYLLTLKSIWN